MEKSEKEQHEYSEAEIITLYSKFLRKHKIDKGNNIPSKSRHRQPSSMFEFSKVTYGRD